MNYFIQFLTYFRILIAPIIFIFIALLNFYGWALILFLFASFSDYWDGYLARKYDLESEIGSILDPIADKILVSFLIIALSLDLGSSLIGLMGGIMGAEVIGIFDIENNIELAFFTPLIAAMGGNVGVQSAAIIVQGLASNNLGMDSLAQRLMKELGVALLNGIICSGLIMIITSLIGYPSSISFTVSISLMAVIIFAALFGTFIPLALDKYKIDPALATGPFITTVNDVLGLFIYFMIGKLFLNL